MKPGKAVVERLLAASPEEASRILAELGPELLRRLAQDWPAWAHDGQSVPPQGDWRMWVMLAGRGFGKTRAGAEWVLGVGAGESGRARSRWSAATPDEARRVMVEGQERADRGGAGRGAGGDALGAEPAAAGLRERGRGVPLFGRAIRKRCAGRSIISPGATSSPSGGRRRRRGTICCSGCGSGERPRALVTTTPRPVRGAEADPGRRRGPS